MAKGDGTMFGFGKKKKKPEKVAEVKQLSVEEIEKLKADVTSLQAEIQKADQEVQPDLYNKLGKTYTALKQLDAAIEAYETSLKVKEQFGDAYNALLSLYEKKRQQAAKEKDDAAIQKWVSKTDDLLSLSKRVMRSTMV